MGLVIKAQNVGRPSSGNASQFHILVSFISPEYFNTTTAINH